MKHKDFLRTLIHLGACDEAVQWVVKHQYDSNTAWNRCRRSDWLLWLVRRDAITGFTRNKAWGWSAFYSPRETRQEFKYSDLKVFCK
jgi:hypothetical protein